ncbi:MAG: peptidase T [Bacteroidales bacterium]|jgi:tripeptide aminopeptidase|nr:peptidase T [Bacteroidales bacterium]MDD2205500.1 peptidase T [Bacteroidales bacterium]MDD3153145.1 peptidase T [Bacteroidales bacterium]MDD3914937.1 peptidase T [Bacteroidales bacterium]MDD4634789.1 peptidase T [Bacteroidales bacterium]
MENIKNKFLRYIDIDTTSDPESEAQPSTQKQFNLLNLLKNELQELGIKTNLDSNGYIMATIPANTDKAVPAIGFIAHVDTSPDAPGTDIKPQIIENYDGKDILLNKENNLYIKVDEFPEVQQYKGQTIITTDGNTLLGADDKAGIAEIMLAAEYIVKTPDFKHGEIKIGFTPDEEIGRGVDKFDVEKFGAKYAYTMDGGEIGELEYENFNAAGAKIHIQGCNIHPGYAKDKMVNSMLIAMELNSMLPVEQRPEYTSNYEGFFHLTGIRGTVEKTDIQYIIRDHDTQKFENKKRLLTSAIDFLNKKYSNRIQLTLKDQYYNMRKEVEPHYHIIEKAIKAMEDAGIKPKIQPIRGGTDGANLSFRNLPCPNIFAGGHNFHGKLEFVPVESMEKATQVILNIISLFAKE